MSAVAEGTTPLGRLAEAEAALPGGASAHARRRAALERLLALGLPGPRDDAWKYSNLRLLGRRDLAPAPPRPVAADALAVLPPREGPTVVFVDGRFHANLSTAVLTPGLSVTPLAGALASTLPPELEARLGASDAIDERIRLLNAALLVDGAHLSVAAGGAPDQEVHVVHLATGGGAYPRLAVTLAPGASARLIEYHLTPGDAESLAAAVADIELGQGARLEHYAITLAGPHAIELHDVSVRVAADATYRHRHLGLGGQLARLDLRVRLEGAGASTQLSGLLLAELSRQVDVRTLVEHVAPHTTSDQVYRGVGKDKGRGSYDGKVVVHKGAMKADSRQSSRNLILSPGASLDSRPQLEINADDVKCSHGATTGALDEQMLFYLLARGLDRDTARALLTFAFAEDVIAKIALPALRRFTEERVLGSLPAAPLIREFIA